MIFDYLQRGNNPTRPADQNRPRADGPETLPLDALRRGQHARLLHVDTRLAQARRLAELGLIPGAELTVLQNGNGPVLLAVRETRIALGRRMAHQLNVELI